LNDSKVPAIASLVSFLRVPEKLRTLSFLLRRLGEPPYWIATLLYQVLLGIAIGLGYWINHDTHTWSQFWGLFHAWDARLYASIAQDGYQCDLERTLDSCNFIAYFPLYPGLMRIVNWLVRNIYQSGILITVVASVIGHVAFAQFLQEAKCDRPLIWRTLIILFLSPVTIYFSLVYTEGIFLAETALFLLFLQRRQYNLAILMGICASATRLFGIFLAIPYLAHFLETDRWLWDRRNLLKVALIPLGLFVYLGMNYIVFNTPFYFLEVQYTNWQKQSVSPWQRYWQEWSNLFRYNINYYSGHPTIAIDALFTLLTPFSLIFYILIRHGWCRWTNRLNNTVRPWCLSWGLLLWTGLQWLLIASQSFWMSNTRYIGLIIPLYVVWADLARCCPYLYWLLVAGFGALAVFGVNEFSRGAWLY
jgi:hypothetical protein